MNPPHDSIADGWSDGNGFSNQLMEQIPTNPKAGRRACGLGGGGETGGDAGRSGGFARQAGEPRDGAGSSGESSRGNTGQSSEGSSQPRKDGDSRGPSQHEEAADEVQGHGRPLVELLALALHRDLLVDGLKIVVFDGKRGQIIYRREDKGEQQEEKEIGESLEELVLAGPYMGISVEYGCFSIKINIPSSSGDKHHSIKWEWVCNNPTYAAQVDTPRPAHHTINAQDGSKVAEVTYAVMSDAREATVQVKFRLKDGHNASGIGGQISALIDGFEDKYRSVLFRCAKGTRRYFSRNNDDDSWFLLELARNVVAVPCGRVLHIEVDLWIETEDGKEVEVKVPLSFDNGICLSKTDDSKEIEVEVTWYPEVKMVSGHHPTVVYTIGDELSFAGFIRALRGILADHPDHEDVLDRHDSSIHSSVREHPVLAKQRAEQPARWIHVKLQVVEGEETFWTTLLMRDDNLYVSGFINQQGVVYELIENPARSAVILPVDEYNPRRLSWGVDYRSLLDADTEQDLLTSLARRMKMGREFAMDAVRVLSGFPGCMNGGLNPRAALAGLMFMVRESARMNGVNTFFARQWNNNKCFDYHELRDDVFNYMSTSQQLLMWKSKGYDNPCPMSQLLDIYLVLNCRLNPPQASSKSRPAAGRPRVELLAMRADLGVDGTTVIVFDGKRGQIIYRKEDQAEEIKGIVDLVLTGPSTSISAYGCFAIKIDIPAEAAGSSKGDAGGSIKWEWDCYDPEYAKQVDEGPKTQTISSSGSGRNVEVTYAVMSNALEATVQVNLRMKDGNSFCSVHGLITASIGNFTHQSILFRRTEEMAQHFSPMTDSPQIVRYLPVRSLKLARNVVAVPLDEMLHIDMHLNIETSKNQGASKKTCFDDTLHFDNGIWSQRRKVDDVDEVEVNVAWYPDSFSDPSEPSPTMEIETSQRQPDISYTVGHDGEGFSTFITELRRLVAEHPRCKDLMADHPQPSSTHNYPVLPRGRVTRESKMSRAQMKPEMLFHIKLEAEAVEGVDETSSITLVLRDDNLDVIGFIKKNGDCYELRLDGDKTELPPEYQSKSLPWRQGGILVEDSTWLGKIILENAVRVLSRCTNEAHPEYRQALAVLIVMVRDSARIGPVGDAIAGGWKIGMQLTKQLQDYRRNWLEISRALLYWRDHAYQGWPQNTELESIGIKIPEDALKVVQLVFNDQNRIFRRTY